MGKMILRMSQVTVGAVGGLLIVPMAVNISTGGTPPSWLTPYIGWLWPAAVGCVVLVILLELWDKLLPDERRITHRPNDPRNYELALAQAARYVELRQRGSLAERVRVALALDERPAAVHQPVHLVQRVSGEAFQLSADLGIGDVFDQMNESMLILGAPGAGKTTQLLDLASALIAREQAALSTGRPAALSTGRPAALSTGRPAALTAHEQAAGQGAEPRIPVVIDLAGWSESRRRRLTTLFSATDSGPRDFTEWLLASLRDRYRIPEHVARTWLADDRFTLLLDGLDEVGKTDRERCVREINALQTRLGVTRMALCSRTADYDELPTRLTLQGAVLIRPLTHEQVVRFFTEISPRPAGVLEALHDDPELWALLTSPLMLNITALAYGARAARALTAGGDQAQRRARLFEAYVVEVLARRRSNEPDTAERMLRAIRALAGASIRLKAGVTVIRINPAAVSAVDPAVADMAVSWLSPAWGATCGIVTATAMGAGWPGLVAGLLVWLPGLSGLSLKPATAKAPRPFPLAVWVLATTMSITAVVFTLRWLSLLLPGLLATAVAIAVTLALVIAACFFVIKPARIAIAAGGLLVSALALWLGISDDVLAGWAVGFGSAICGSSQTLGVFSSSASSSYDDTVRVASTYRIWQALLYTGAIIVVPVVVVPVVVAGGWSTLSWSSLAGWLVGAGYGIIPGIAVSYYLTRPVLRPVFAIAGEPFPWRRALLRFATDRSLLMVVDGEYRFIHILVRDYLAGCDPHRLAKQVNRRRAELTASRLAATLPHIST
jgi:hypothetical protein